MSTCKLKTANYPDYLGWGRLATVIKLGTVIQEANGQQYIVKEKLLSDVVGAQPRLRLEPIINHVPKPNSNSNQP
jgi:hypothetical protein